MYLTRSHTLTKSRDDHLLRCDLQEGVQRFSQDGQWGFQWTRILQYGVGRYHHSRTARDLRDKWRSMIKGCTY